ncbi:MAG: DUF3008 family protein [Novosphingobium sp.]|nr:DUF3008 family protein [Novosphingobium sp.]
MTGAQGSHAQVAGSSLNPQSRLRGASKQMEESMTEKQLEDFARTDGKDLPEKKN